MCFKEENMGISNFIDKINKLIGYLSALICIPLTFIIVFEISMRYFFNKPTEWAYDVSWMLFAAMFLLGGAYTLQEERHVRVDIIARVLPLKLQKTIELLFYFILFLPMTLVLAWKGFDFTLVAWRAGEMLSTTLFVFPAWATKIFIPIGFCLLFLQGISQVIKIIRPSGEDVK